MNKEVKYPNRIRELALEKGILINKLARAMGLAEMTLYDAANGKRLPHFETCRKLEMIFGVPISEIYPDSYKGITIYWNLLE